MWAKNKGSHAKAETMTGDIMKAITPGLGSQHGKFQYTQFLPLEQLSP